MLSFVRFYSCLCACVWVCVCMTASGVFCKRATHILEFLDSWLLLFSLFQLDFCCVCSLIVLQSVWVEPWVFVSILFSSVDHYAQTNMKHTIDIKYMHLIDLADGYYYLQLNLFSIACMCQIFWVRLFFRPTVSSIPASFFFATESNVQDIFFSTQSNSKNEYLWIVSDGIDRLNAAIKASSQPLLKDSYNNRMMIQEEKEALKEYRWTAKWIVLIICYRHSYHQCISTNELN